MTRNKQDKSVAGDSPDYVARKRRFDSLLTVYGRKPVLEALQDNSIPVFRLHLADSNQSSGIMRDIERLARAREVEIRHHDRESLSRISRNRKQDQGVALDLNCPRFQHFEDFLEDRAGEAWRLIALDRITNPQNLGMIIRSVCASPIDGLLLPSKGCAPISPLVIKASAGTLFHCPILRCNSLEEALPRFRQQQARICTLAGAATQTLAQFDASEPVIYVMGNETDGVSDPVARLATDSVRIPMCNGVESLNVAVAAALVAFRDSFLGSAAE